MPSAYWRDDVKSQEAAAILADPDGLREIAEALPATEIDAARVISTIGTEAGAAAVAGVSTKWLGGLTDEVARTLSAGFLDRPISVKAFGAKCDYVKKTTGGGVPAGSSTVTGSGFTSADVGKLFYITNNTTIEGGVISGYTNSTTITVTFTGTGTAANTYANAEYGYGTNDSDAVEATMRYCARRALHPGPDGGLSILIPGPTVVTRAVLSYLPTAGLYGPIRWVGNGWQTSGFVLWPTSAAELFLYDSNSVQSYYLNQFGDMFFEGGGPHRLFASLFRLKASSGHDQQFHYTRCMFARGKANRGWVLNGSTNADKLSWSQCFFGAFHGTIFTVNNSQSLCHNFLGSHFEGFLGNFIDILDGTDGNGIGGGSFVEIWGASLAYGTGTGAKQWLVTAAGSSTVSSSVSFWGCRTENFEIANGGTDSTGLVKKTSSLGGLQVNFYACDFGRNNPTNTFEAVRIDVGASVYFNRCRIPDKMTYRFLNTSGAIGGLREPGSILMDTCAVPDGLSALVTFDNTYGSFETRNSIPINVSQTARATVALDMQLGTRLNPASMGRFIKRKAVSFLPGTAYYFPRTGGVSGAISDPATELTVTLPLHAVIVGFEILKPASGASTAAYQINVGTNDRATTWAASASAAEQYKDAHYIDTNAGAYASGHVWDVRDFIFCGTDANKLTVRLWASQGGAFANQTFADGAMALLYYI